MDKGKRRIRTGVRVAAAGGVLVAGAWWVGSADNAAHAAKTSVVQSKTSAQVVSEARKEYGLPVTTARCWATGPNLFSCQLWGNGGFRAIATGEIIGGTARASFS